MVVVSRPGEIEHILVFQLGSQIVSEVVDQVHCTNTVWL